MASNEISGITAVGQGSQADSIGTVMAQRALSNQKLIGREAVLLVESAKAVAPTVSGASASTQQASHINLTA
jgi:hypothetical protein